jgi:uncharacterized phage protein (TIGR01671 family)
MIYNVVPWQWDFCLTTMSHRCVAGGRPFGGGDEATFEIPGYAFKEINQFIGLSDKKGREIFTDDIIKIEHPHKERSFIGQVKLIGHRFGCEGFGFTHFDDPSDIFCDGTSFIEVIGNIHEHPERLPK